MHTFSLKSARTGVKHFVCGLVSVGNIPYLPRWLAYGYLARICVLNSQLLSNFLVFNTHVHVWRCPSYADEISWRANLIKNVNCLFNVPFPSQWLKKGGTTSYYIRRKCLVEHINKELPISILECKVLFPCQCCNWRQVITLAWYMHIGITSHLLK